jgi:hypothetical protein
LLGPLDAAALFSIDQSDPVAVSFPRSAPEVPGAIEKACGLPSVDGRKATTKTATLQHYYGINLLVFTKIAGRDGTHRLPRREPHRPSVASQSAEKPAFAQAAQ